MRSEGRGRHGDPVSVELSCTSLFPPSSLPIPSLLPILSLCPRMPPPQLSHPRSGARLATKLHKCALCRICTAGSQCTEFRIGLYDPCWISQGSHFSPLGSKNCLKATPFSSCCPLVCCIQQYTAQTWRFHLDSHPPQRDTPPCIC